MKGPPEWRTIPDLPLLLRVDPRVYLAGRGGELQCLLGILGKNLLNGSKWSLNMSEEIYAGQTRRLCVFQLLKVRYKWYKGLGIAQRSFRMSSIGSVLCPEVQAL